MGVSGTITVLCALSLVLATLAAVQVKGTMIPQQRLRPKTAVDSIRVTNVDENDIYEEIGMKPLGYENFH